MGEIAGIFHWPPAVLEAVTLEELIFWHKQAVTWWNRVNTPPK